MIKYKYDNKKLDNKDDILYNDENVINYYK